VPFGAEVAVAEGQVRSLPEDAFAPIARPSFQPTKGGEVIAMPGGPPSEGRLKLFVGAGVTGATATSLLAMPGLRLGLAARKRWSPTMALDLAAGRADAFTESRFELMAGLQRRREWTRLALSFGAEVGGGLGVQTIDGGATRASGLVTLGITASFSVAVTSAWSIAAAVQAPARFLRREGETVTLFQPAAWLGFVLGL